MVRVAGFEPTASWSRISVGKSKGRFRLRLGFFTPNPGSPVSCLFHSLRPDFSYRGSGCGSGGYCTVPFFEESLSWRKEEAGQHLKF